MAVRRTRRARGQTAAVLIALVAMGLALAAYRYVLLSLYPVPYRDLIWRYATQNKLDPYLVAAVIKVESNFRPDAVSSKGAVGLMQLMPDTARWAAGRMGVPAPTAGELSDPETNIRIGTWYLAELQDEFGNWVLSLAAYNAGRGVVRGWVDDGVLAGQNPVAEQIPFSETKNFVRRVLQAQKRYRQLYGQ